MKQKNIAEINLDRVSKVAIFETGKLLFMTIEATPFNKNLLG